MVAATSPAPRVLDEYVGTHGLSSKDANLLQQLIDDIHRDKGRLETSDLYQEIVRRSRPANSLTHHLYEWDLGKAHALYLLERTRRLVMSVRVVFSEAPDEKPVQAFPVVTYDGKRGPAPMRAVLSNREQSSQLMEQALADLDRWRNRYDHLKRLAPVLQAISVSVKKVKRK